MNPGLPASAPGPEVGEGGTTSFRVWAPSCGRVDVVLENADGSPRCVQPLQPLGEGYHAAVLSPVRAGDLYRFLLDGRGPFADPASRFQPAGPLGPSQVVDGRAFPWTDQAWKGLGGVPPVLYEMHIGTFSTEGTWEAAGRQLPALRDLGVTAVEVMPIGDFPGDFGWGYDGVCLYAPTRLYGTPDDFRRFVDRAHAENIGVVLDVVYNHFGPRGAVHREFAGAYFHPTRQNDWGSALNFDGPGAGPVREFFIRNAEYWIEEFHLDGLRFDAAHAMVDSSEDHILRAVVRAARRRAPGRSLLLTAEHETPDIRFVLPDSGGGLGLDAVWNDEFHHVSRVALTGCREGYLSSFAGTAKEMVGSILRGIRLRGLHFLENHDHVANAGGGHRLAGASDPARLRALTALLLLAPPTPLLFQGQEWNSTSPFHYFADHPPELALQVQEGRRTFLSPFASSRGAPDPSSREAFERCKLRRPASSSPAIALHRDLILLRNGPEGFHLVDVTVSGEAMVELQFQGDAGSKRRVLVNLGGALERTESPGWTIRWSSEEVGYGGSGRPLGLCLPGNSALVLDSA